MVCSGCEVDVIDGVALYLHAFMQPQPDKKEQYKVSNSIIDIFFLSISHRSCYKNYNIICPQMHDNYNGK